MVAQYCLPQPSRRNSLQSKKSLPCYQQTNTHFDSSSDALHTEGPMMKAAVSVLAEGWLKVSSPLMTFLFR